MQMKSVIWIVLSFCCSLCFVILICDQVSSKVDNREEKVDIKHCNWVDMVTNASHHVA